MRSSVLVLLCAALILVVKAPSPAAGQDAGAGYQKLVRLFEEWRAFQKPVFRDGVPDYTAAAMQAQREGLPEMRARLEAIDTAGWSVAQKIDKELVRAEMNGLDFDHRVLRPWQRQPSFYSVVVDAQSDTPSREGSVMHGTIELWRMPFPLPANEVEPFRKRLRAIPAILEQARVNLTDDARDLWVVGIRTQQEQSQALAGLAGRMAKLHTELVPDVERAKQAVDGFRAWLEQELPKKHGPSGIGVEDYDWYLRHVHLVPYTWQDELRLVERELARATAHLKLEEHQNRALPPLQPPPTAEEWQRMADASVTRFVEFLRAKEVFTVTDSMEPAQRMRLAGFVPEGERDFFTQVDMREPLVMRCHSVHWFDTARMEHDPHPSPIRRVALLYNIWDSRSEGFATAMEEMMMSAGLFAENPRARELVYVMVAQRAARAIAGLRMHGSGWTIEQAIRFAHENTPRGWLRADGGLVWGEQQLYLEQPGYGTSYLTGKALLESLMAERSRQKGDAFTVRGFMDELFASGMIPVSLIRWELTGKDDEVRRLAGGGGESSR
jgi:hypothetical protein